MLGLNFIPPAVFQKLNNMPIEVAKNVVAALDDLFFTVKINEAAKRVGLGVAFVKSERDVLDQAKGAPLLIIIDLNFSGIEPVELIRKLKDDPELRKISLLGYVSHVQGELKQAAQEAGCDMVLARSAFSQNLQQIMRRHAEARDQA
jgi:CheY-like chemotaxis protein